MTQGQTNATGAIRGSGGLRAVGARYSELEKISEGYEGLPEGVSKDSLLRNVRVAAREYGLTPAEFDYLAYLIAFTHEVDWQPYTVSHPIVYQSVLATALHFGVSERQVRNWERAIHDKTGWLTWRDYGSHKRFGARDERGRLLYGYGVDLAPLAAQYAEIEQLATEAQEVERTWKACRREISALKRSITAKVGFLFDLGNSGQVAEDAWREVESLPRIAAGTPLKTLLSWRERLRSAAEAVSVEIEKHRETVDGSRDISAPAEREFRHIQTTNNQESANADTCSPQGREKRGGVPPQPAAANHSGLEGSPEEPVSRDGPVKASKAPESGPERSGSQAYPSGSDKITLKMLLNAASEELRGHLPVRPGVPLDWSQVVEAAEKRRAELGISPSAWVDACLTIGRVPAAVAVAVIDRNTGRIDWNTVENPGGYLRAMVGRAREGQLDLGKSVFGILARNDWGETEGG